MPKKGQQKISTLSEQDLACIVEIVRKNETERQTRIQDKIRALQNRSKHSA